MFLDNDFLSFLDGGSKVPFQVKEGRYIPTPRNIIETIEYDNKLYYNCSSGYFVGCRLSSYVRSITAQDYRYIINEYETLEESKILVNKTQLIMDFC